MADQATLKRLGAGGNGTATTRANSAANDGDPSASGVVSNVAGFGENLLTLAELQARLAAVEFRQNLEYVKTGGALVLAAVILGVSGIPVLLIAVAELLVSELGLKRGFALLSAAAAALVIAGGCIAIAGRWLRRNPLGFPLSNEEFAQELELVADDPPAQRAYALQSIMAARIEPSRWVDDVLDDLPHQAV